MCSEVEISTPGEKECHYPVKESSLFPRLSKGPWKTGYCFKTATRRVGTICSRVYATREADVAWKASFKK